MLRERLICLVLCLIVCGSLIAAYEAPCVLDYSKIAPITLPGSPKEFFGHYVRELGKGTSGVVSLYTSNISGEAVVLKSFPLETSSANKTVCENNKRQTREVKLEFYIGKLLNGIDSVVQTHDLLYDHAACTWHIATEYISDSLAKSRNSLSVDSLIEVLRKLKEALQAIHHLGISHGDVKLENVLLTPILAPILIDFGTATFSHCPVEAPIGNDGEVLTNMIPGDYGTVAYMAPEVVLSSGVDYDRAKADIWSLGILASILFTSRTSWKRASMEDPGWRSFMGWQDDDAHGFCRQWPQSTMWQQPTCSRAKAEFLESIPAIMRLEVGAWLELDPAWRSFEI